MIRPSENVIVLVFCAMMKNSLSFRCGKVETLQVNDLLLAKIFVAVCEEHGIQSLHP